MKQQSSCARRCLTLTSSTAERLPSNGYRAVHVVTTIGDRHVEIQIRTELQHLWAELSEKLADSVDPALKYGGGDAKIRDWLLGLSARIARIEWIKEMVSVTHAAGRVTKLPSELVEKMAEFDREVTAARTELDLIHQQLTSIAERAKRGQSALPD